MNPDPGIYQLTEDLIDRLKATADGLRERVAVSREAIATSHAVLRKQPKSASLASPGANQTETVP